MRQSVPLAAAALAFASLWPVTASAVAFQVGNRPEIGAIQAPKTAKPGISVPITITAKKDGNSACGMVVTFGDGTEKQFKMNSDHGKFPVTTEHTYKKDGTYTVRASGRIITTNKECKSSASAVIQVGEVKAAPKKTTAK